MSTVNRDEVEAAFRNYWALGAVGEDWDAWCDECFTEDVTYIEHILGSKNGREEVRGVDQADDGGLRGDLHRVRVAHDR